MKKIYLYTERASFEAVIKKFTCYRGVKFVFCKGAFELKRLDNSSENSLITFGISEIIQEGVFKSFSNAINIHAASPEYPGRDPHHYAIYDKAKQYGAVAHIIEKKVDTGDIIDAELFDVPPNISAQGLLDLANNAGMTLLMRIVLDIVESKPIHPNGMKWSGIKRSRNNFNEFLKLKPYDSYNMIYDKYHAFQKGSSYKNLSMEMFGLTFRYESGVPTTDKGDFTLEVYKSLLQLIKHHYTFIHYHQYDSVFKNKVVWRHDIDFSIKNSLKLAQIEHDLGIKSSYFVMLGSPYYDIREYASRHAMKKIKELGHEVGLHYDSLYLQWSPIETYEEYEKSLLEQKKELERILDMPIKIFSHHNPTTFDNTLFAEICQHTYQHGMINVYANNIQRHFHYVSDSNGIWRHGKVSEYIDVDRYPNLHILTHPLWWSDYSTTPRTKVLNELFLRVTDIMHEYDALLKKHQRINY